MTQNTKTKLQLAQKTQSALQKEQLFIESIEEKLHEIDSQMKAKKIHQQIINKN